MQIAKAVKEKKKPGKINFIRFIHSLGQERIK